MTYSKKLRRAKGLGTSDIRVACLHTHADAIQPYEAACGPATHLTHYLRSDLHRRAEDGMTDALRSEVRAHCERLRRGADVVLVTSDMMAEAGYPNVISAAHVLSETVLRRARGRSVDIFFCDPPVRPVLEASYAPLLRDGAARLVDLPHVGDLLARRHLHEALDVAEQVIGQSTCDLVVITPAPLAPLAATLNLPQGRPVLTAPDAVFAVLEDRAGPPGDA